MSAAAASLQALAPAPNGVGHVGRSRSMASVVPGVKPHDREIIAEAHPAFGRRGPMFAGERMVR